jgi:hypothetical protein
MTITLVGVLVWTMGAVGVAQAAAVHVRLPEGAARGFLVLRAVNGDHLADGELQQKTVGHLVDSRLVLKFRDGSVRDEVTVFSQQGVFRLERYRLVQRGPSFPTMEVSFDRKTGRYQALVQEKKGGEEKRADGPLEMPADLYNGLFLLLARNVVGDMSLEFQTAVFLPRPRLIKTVLIPAGNENLQVGGLSKKAIRYLVKLELGGLTGVMAPLLGKKPPETRYWFVIGDVPAFVKFEGAMFLNGPVWQIEQAAVRWPK